MVEIEETLKQLLEGQIWSGTIKQELESRGICLNHLLINKQRLAVVDLTDESLIRQSLTELKKNFRGAVKQLLGQPLDSPSREQEAVRLLLTLFLKRRQKLRLLTADQLDLLKLPEVRRYVLVSQKEVLFRNNLYFLTNKSKADLVCLRDLLLTDQPGDFRALLQGAEPADDGLRNWLRLYGPLYEQVRYGACFSPDMELAGFRHVSRVRDERVYYVLRYLLKEEPALPPAPGSLRKLFQQKLVCHEAFK